MVSCSKHTTCLPNLPFVIYFAICIYVNIRKDLTQGEALAGTKHMWACVGPVLDLCNSRHTRILDQLMAMKFVDKVCQAPECNHKIPHTPDCTKKVGHTPGQWKFLSSTSSSISPCRVERIPGMKRVTPNYKISPMG